MHRAAQQILLLQMHRTAQQIILLQMHRAVQQQIPTAQISSTSGTTDNVTGGVTVEDDKKSTENVTGDVIVDENNDKVEIKKDDKPYLALGADLSDDQKNIVLSLWESILPILQIITSLTLQMHRSTSTSIPMWILPKSEASPGLLS